MTSSTAPTAAPRLSRRHAAGAESARGLLFTVLGEFVLPHGGACWTSAVIDVLGRLGVEEKASRQALMRTAADGWLTAERFGRRSRWSLTDAARDLLTEGSERIYGFRAAADGWDGRWVLVLARAPETERTARHRVRTRLTWAGCGSPAPGVWVSTHADRLEEVRRVLADSGILAESQLFTAEHAGGGSLPGLVAQAWDLDGLDAGYRDFLAEFAAAGTGDRLTRVAELVHAWRRFPWVDPVLPTALLPPRWSGVRAAALFAQQHARWSAQAAAEWCRINAVD